MSGRTSGLGGAIVEYLLPAKALGAATGCLWLMAEVAESFAKPGVAETAKRELGIDP